MINKLDFLFYKLDDFYHGLFWIGLCCCYIPEDKIILMMICGARGLWWVMRKPSYN